MPDNTSLVKSRREPDYDFLDPVKSRLSHSEGGQLRLTIEDEKSYLEVKAVWAFPFSCPGRYLALLDARDRDMTIGMIPDLSELDAESQRLIQDALAGHYFMPSITRIRSFKEEFGTMYFDVETTRGRRRFVARGIRDGLEELEEGELIIPDVDGNRYRVADWRNLDRRSRRYLARFC